MRIDLHTHSNRSDGTDSPAELVLAARDAGLDVVALTDHDTTRGWAEAAKVAENVGVQLVRWSRRQVLAWSNFTRVGLVSPLALGVAGRRLVLEDPE